MCNTSKYYYPSTTFCLLLVLSPSSLRSRNNAKRKTYMNVCEASCMYICTSMWNFMYVHVLVYEGYVSPRIAGQWDVQGAWCNRYTCRVRHMILRRAAGTSTRAFANHFFSRLKFVGLRSPNRNNPNKYHSTPDTYSLQYDYSADYFNDPYNSRDLNPTEPMNHGCGSRRE